MERIKPGFPTLIAEALRLIPLHIHTYLACDIFTETDPVFAGLHPYVETELISGRTYAECPHVVYPYHMMHRPVSDRRVTMFLPSPDLHEYCVVHEFGHVLHWWLGFPSPHIEPVSAYAHGNAQELFAEAFAAWVCPEWYGAHPGPAFDALMASLA